MKTNLLQRLVIAGVALAIGLGLIIGCWLLFGERIANKFLPDNPWPSLHANNSADPALVQQFEDLINRESVVMAGAYKSFDMKDFPQVYVDDPAVPLSRDQAKYVKEVKSNQTGASDLIQGEGWLSFSQALILSYGSGVRAYQVQATLATQGKTMSADDYRRVGAPVPPPGATPTLVPSVLTVGDVADPNGYKFKVRFKSVTVEGDRAEVTYINGDDGKIVHTFLVETATGWRIAGLRRLSS